MQETEEKVKRSDVFAHDHTKIPASSNFLKDEDDGPFITIIIDRNKEREQLDEQNHQLSDYQSSTSQVLPLATAPSTSKSAAKKSSFF